ncbi:MAG: hypothetical protein AB8H80_09765 [Planctomycetota bacterium]
MDPGAFGDGDGGLTLRELIERIVRSEVASFERRQEVRKFVRALSARERQAIPGRVFSETVRDMDLVVSVAHQGGVDAEATASTL